MGDLDKEVDSSTVIDDVKYRPDYILVVDNGTATDENIEKVLRFLGELKSIGVHHDSEEFSGNPDLGFIKLHGPQPVLLKQAEKHNIELACFTLPEFKPPNEKPSWKFMRNELNDRQPNGEVEKRAPELVNVNAPMGITSAERILLLYTIMNNTRYGKEQTDVGLESLLKCGAVMDSFALHDGNHHWPEKGDVNERQFLNKYWSRMSCMFQSQPLDMINHYFGTSTGFYFAWLGFYNKMLLPLAFLGVAFFIIGLSTFRNIHVQLADEICKSDLIVCPRCQTHEFCSYKKLSASCFQATYSHAFDNPVSFMFALVTGVWAVIFLRRWLRKECVLQLRWNVKDLEVDSASRFGFLLRAKNKKKSPITGQEVPYITKMEVISMHFLSLFIMGTMLAANAFMIIILLMWSHNLVTVIGKHTTKPFVEKHASIIASVIASFTTVTFVVIYEKIYRIVAWELTNIQNPRSQIDFENSYVIKIYILAFVNNYTGLFYIAFIKGRFYTNPGDQRMYERYLGIGTDICDQFGCMWDLGIMLMVTLVFKKTALMHLIHWMQTAVLDKVLARKKATGTKGMFKRFSYDKTKQWEREFMLNQDSNLEVLDEYLDMAIQYGYVTFFAACFPLAATAAFLNNIIELRLDARKKTVEKRRIVPIKVMGIGAWHTVFLSATIISFISNAMIIAFASDLTKKIVYLKELRSLSGYVDFSLSVFDTQNFVDVEFKSYNYSLCYYPGHKYDAHHEDQYRGTKFFPYLYTVDVIFVVIFVHIMFLLSAFIVHFTPKIPFSVKQLINMKEDYLADLKRIVKAKPEAPRRKSL